MILRPVTALMAVLALGSVAYAGGQSDGDRDKPRFTEGSN